IRSGETSGSARDTKLQAAIRGLGNARLELRNATASKSLAPDLTKISSLMTAVDSAVSGRTSLLARLIADDYIEFQQRCGTVQAQLPLPPGTGWDAIEADMAALEDIGRRAAKRLLRLYRFAEQPAQPDPAATSSAAVA